MTRNDIKPEVQTIQEYFKLKEFHIPSYQRPYAWQVEHCEQLIEDIKNHQENFDHSTQDNYFFGAVLIAQDAGEEHQINLIDGQQRTTTFMILLKTLMLRINEELVHLSGASAEDERLVEKLKNLKNLIIKMLYNLDDDKTFDFNRNNYQLIKEDIKYSNDSISELYDEDMITILLGSSFDSIKRNVLRIPRRQKDNKYTNYYKNFRYFYNYLEKLTNTQIRDFTSHLIDQCQVISIISFNTDQAINIFNSLNGTGVPLTPIEVIVSKTTATAVDRKIFENNWQLIVEKADNSSLNLNLLMTHYIFMKLSEFNGKDTRNPGIKAFFSKNKKLLEDDSLFTSQLDTILDNSNHFESTELGQILSKFNGNIKPFVSSFNFFRDNEEFLLYLLRIAAVLELSDLVYGNRVFKGFLEKLNLKYSQKGYSDNYLISKIKKHISENFDRNNIEQTLKESGVPNSIIFLNEFIYCKNRSIPFDITGSVDIEHVMSKSGLNRVHIMNDANLTSENEFNEYAEKLGNKILLESSINRGLGDSWFRTKKETSIASNSGYKGSKYQIASSLVNYPSDTWIKDDIDIATEKAAKRISDFIFE